jgi:hypothetical protein
MSYSPENFSGATANGISRLTRERAQEAMRAGRECAQQNPVPVVLGALAIGVIVGLLCGRREPKPRDAGQLAREFFEDAASRLAHRLHWEGSSPWRDHLSGLGRKWQGGRFW